MMVLSGTVGLRWLTLFPPLTVIQQIRAVVSEWDQISMDEWREDQTRYGVIDLIIQALGWNTADPKECHPEYPLPSIGGRVDYALFRELSVDDVASGDVAPIVIIESKALRSDLAAHMEQLQVYAVAEPSMSEGVAVLTNGNQWLDLRPDPAWRLC